MQYKAGKPESVKGQSVKVIVTCECELPVENFLGLSEVPYIKDDSELQRHLLKLASEEDTTIHGWLSECDFWSGEYSYDVSLIK